ncbi:MAG: type II toxin-antitoxin system RelE/ParE family toxin [Flavobacteriia bacterium]|nr:type II toxin-antitoxin system RelE/ParE family toxin [Flavobacteriia bacterium]
MNNKLVLSKRSIQQINKASTYFSLEKSGLEILFLKELETNLKYIKKNPLKCQIRYKGIRIKFLKKFNFGIHYLIEQNTIYVLAVFHTSQNSDEW